MRIIAGSSKGTRLKTVQSFHVRPTTDRVKESLFQVIGPFFDGGWVLDLFAGSGSLGLEALSRGADRAVFVDRDRASVDVIRRNLEAARMGRRAEVYQRDARAALRILAKRETAFRLIFLDPPYKEDILPDILTAIDERKLLEEGGWVIAEHGGDRPLGPAYGRLVQSRSLVYGDTQIDLYTREADSEEGGGNR
ncbi:16S rRNA (guanine(966)-N(2))-methyltransferase RsmD [Salinithrix halophila]|uniref:16S rRNA (Guanine(966)-N(2))-methyltransferase RsmD n=1 Tax=Salinithrix halophila TaxID=1485204 RepID=A0ABV8JKD5_9BACL